MKLKKGKYKGLFICDLVNECNNKHQYLLMILTHEKTPEYLKEVIKAMLDDKNQEILSKFKKLPDSLKTFWSNENRNFIHYLETQNYDNNTLSHT